MEINIDFFVTETGRANSGKLKESYSKKNLPDLYNSVIDYCRTKSLMTEKFAEKLYLYFNKYESIPLCKHCNINRLPFGYITTGYTQSFCSFSCSNGSEHKKNKIKEKYGVDNVFQLKSTINKIKKTFNDRYGVNNPMDMDSVKDKMKANHREKHGTDWGLSKGGPSNIKRINNEIKNFKEKHDLKFEVLYFPEIRSGICELISKECGHRFKISKHLLRQRTDLNNTTVCTTCNPIGSFSETKGESLIRDFLIENSIEFVQHYRPDFLNNLELDFYIPSHNLAIEFNGVYWHSDFFKDKDYHISKTKLCAENNIRLIHIFEDEFTNTPEIVKGRILSILKLNLSQRIFARKCIVKEIDSKTSSRFLEENHLQGNINSGVRIGLYYNDDLISVATFGKIRKSLGSVSKEGTWELYRLVTKIGYSCIGGASKLMKKFITTYKPNKILSYADYRWSVGGVYERLGFENKGLTSPGYWYVKNGIRYHRYGFRKDVLIKNGFDKNKTEYEIMIDDGYVRLWDCGNLRYELQLV